MPTIPPVDLVTCSGCRGQFNRSVMLTSTWDDLYCPECFNLRLYHCEACGALEWRGDVPGDRLCGECWNRQRRWNATAVSHITSIKKTTTSRHFGIELETSDCPNHTDLRGRTCFGVKEDGSISGLEFVSPILSGDRGLAEVRKFCRLAKQKGFEVDEDCGYHLHINMSDMTVDQRKHVAYAYRATLTLWQHLVKSDRWNNTFCQPANYTAQDIINSHNFEDFERGQCRYQFVNIRAFRSHSTYELRGYQGTLDPTEICNWIKVNLRFVEFVKDKDFDELRQLFGRGLRKAKRTMRKIFGQRLANYYSKLWRQHAHRIARV